MLARVAFLHIRTPRTLAEVDLSAITAALAEARASGQDENLADPQPLAADFGQLVVAKLSCTMAL